jgi:molecular chaperone HscB
VTNATPDLRQNFFELFELPVSCPVDKKALRTRYMALQREFHPDKYAAADDQHRRMAVQIAARVNQAHDTLSDPLKCAEYCLELQGVDIDAETDSSMDTGFLMEQMEWREKLEDITDAGSADALNELRSEIAGRIELIGSQTAEKLDQQDATGARELVRKWQFLFKIDREAQSVGSRLNA